jgi:hypothetical protein
MFERFFIGIQQLSTTIKKTLLTFTASNVFLIEMKQITPLT